MHQSVYATALAATVLALNAQTPAIFPAITVSIHDPGKVAEGYIFLASLSILPGASSFLMILDNDGRPVDGNKYKELLRVTGDFKVQASGLLSYADSFFTLPYTGGWDVDQRIVDESLINIVETIQMKNGYLHEFHDFQLLPNGHALTMGYYLSEVDMSRIVNGGHPAARVSGTVIQELDAQRNAVFQWRSWDYYDFEDHTYANPTAAMLSEFHINNINLDIDGHIIAGTPHEIRKINRQTGEVLWTLGGGANEFTFVDGDVSHFGGHGTYRLKNGNILMYNNAVGATTSRVHEYALDETNKIGTRVWSYIPPRHIAGRFTGNAQRLENGNTLICWGLPRTMGIPVCTEITSEGEVVFELFFDNPELSSYRAYRFPYPVASRTIEHLEQQLSAGNDYDFGDTGVNIDVQSLAGVGYNEVTVIREPYAPVFPSFLSKPPRVLPVRVRVIESEIAGMTAVISYNAAGFGFEDPAQLTVYHRPTPGSGQFTELATAPYDPLAGQVRVTMTQFGEFIFGYPDVEDIANPPILHRPENYRGVQRNMIVAPRQIESNAVYTVNQELPVYLSWSPRGFGRYYALQIATDETFTSPEVDLSFQSDAFHVMSNVMAGATYHWRARSIVESNGFHVAGDWSTGSFQTEPPRIGIVAANGGEFWQRGHGYFIQWNANIQGNVSIDLHKDDAFLEVITTNTPGTGAYMWEPGFNLDPGTDYSIKITSVSAAGLFAVSAAHFNIDVPEITTITVSGGSIVLGWDGTSAGVYVEHNPGFSPIAWREIAGPIMGNSWTNTTPPGDPTGYYRLRLESGKP